MWSTSIFSYFICGIVLWIKLCNAYDPYYPSSRNPAPYEFEDQNYWQRIGRTEVNEAFNRRVIWNTAKNVIVMVADGMDPNTVTASRILATSESGKLSFEHFPHMGFLKTYSTDKKVPDAAATGTAIFTGVKTNNHVIGLDARVHFEDCRESNSVDKIVPSIMQWAQESGKSTGFVTNKRVTDALASALYAHTASRFMECNQQYRDSTTLQCKDIARQLVEDHVGRNFKVIFGGGRQCLMTDSPHSIYDTLDIFTCLRSDNRNLIEEWIRDKTQKSAVVSEIRTISDLNSLDPYRTEYAIGIFANSDLPFEADRNRTSLGMPSLESMVEPAIKILTRDRQNGFVLMVQGGLIDKAHHEGNARKALEETVAFHKTVSKTMQVLRNLGIEDETLVLVTGGHGHTMSINGYPNRNESILGVADKSKHDAIPYTTLTYATGSVINYQYIQKDNYVYRQDPTRTDTTGENYHQQAAILTDKETHGGGDVTVYGIGPMAHMLYGVHEQTYIANVIAYAAKIGPHRINSAIKSTPTVFIIFSSAIALLLPKAVKNN